MANADIKENAIIKNKNASKIQALFRGTKFRSKVLPDIITKDLLNKRIKRLQQQEYKMQLEIKMQLKKLLQHVPT
jgi:hypothetical protein